VRIHTGLDVPPIVRKQETFCLSRFFFPFLFFLAPVLHTSLSCGMRSPMVGIPCLSLDPVFAERFEWEDSHSLRDIWEWAEDEGRVGWVDDIGGDSGRG
jgi:hypothetical protein